MNGGRTEGEGEAGSPLRRTPMKDPGIMT